MFLRKNKEQRMKETLKLIKLRMIMRKKDWKRFLEWKEPKLKQGLLSFLSTNHFYQFLIGSMIELLRI